MMQTRFLNVDLDIRANCKLDELLSVLSPTFVIINNRSEDFASIELAHQPLSADDAILAFYNLIISLPLSARRIWDKCNMRSMNIGIQAGKDPYLKSFTLSSKAISLLSSLNADIVITVYAAID